MCNCNVTACQCDAKECERKGTNAAVGTLMFGTIGALLGGPIGAVVGAGLGAAVGDSVDEDEYEKCKVGK